MIFGLLFCFPGSGQSIETLLSNLKSGEEIKNTFWRGGSPTLLPDIDRKEEIKAQLRELDPTVSVEVLTAYEHEGLDLDSAAALLAIYNILLSISTMEGIEYYSASRGRMRTLFSESYCIDSPESKKRLHDPEVDSIPPYSRIYNLQRDLTFGENIYLSEYFLGGEYIMLKNRNLTTMRYLLLPMVQPNNIFTYFIFIPSGNKLIFYGLTSAHTLKFFGLERTREASFYNRLKAIYGWFIDRLNAELF
ncbi:hypothetical protein ES703_65472 [subsurface metagenome]